MCSLASAAVNLLDAVRLLTNVSEAFRGKCLEGLTANVERCNDLVEQSLAMCTALASRIGYDAAADIAKEAFRTGKTVRQVAQEKNTLPADELTALLDPHGQTGP
jgi:fumarate hydratase class II